MHTLSIALVAVLLTVSPVQAAEPIKVGFLAPMTGLFAQAGKDMLDGLKMGLEQDTEGNPATAQAKYRKLVQQDKIHVLTGILPTSATRWCRRSSATSCPRCS